VGYCTPGEHTIPISIYRPAYAILSLLFVECELIAASAREAKETLAAETAARAAGVDNAAAKAAVDAAGMAERSFTVELAPSSLLAPAEALVSLGGLSASHAPGECVPH